jgi:ClpX C4-type zinc finger
MESTEPINFLQERRTRRPGEEVVVEKPPRRSPARQKQLPAPPPQVEPEPKLERKPEPKKGPHCSCCGNSQERMKVFLDAGRGVLLCDGCVEVCNEILSAEGIATDTPVSSKQTSTSHSYSRTIYRCSFCGKEQELVGRLIAMLNQLFICNNCVGLCNAGITQALSNTSAKAGLKMQEGELAHPQSNQGGS